MLGDGQVVDHHFGRPHNFIAPAVTALKNREDSVVRSSRIMALSKRFVLVRVERLADEFFTLDPVLAKQLLQLFQRHFNTLMKLCGIARGTRSQSSFEIIYDR